MITRCLNRWIFVSLTALHLLAMPAGAQMVFARAEIRIDPAAQEDQPQRVSLTYNIELRSEEALSLDYIHTLNTLSDTTGVAIMFNEPSIAALPRMQVFTPVDALFVADNGTILQIYPNVVLGDLQQEVYAKDPIAGFIFLKAGEVQARGIRPHDIVAGSMFAAAPPIME